MLFLTASTSAGIVDALVQLKLKMSSTRGSWLEISIKGDRSCTARISKAPSGWLTIVKIVCKMSLVVSGGLILVSRAFEKLGSRLTSELMLLLKELSVRSVSFLSEILRVIG